MHYELHKISLSNKEVKFTTTENEHEYELLFDNCVSKLNLKNLFSEGNIPIDAESMWSDTCEIFKDNFIVRDEVPTPRFPKTEGYRVFSVTWASSTATDDGFIVVKIFE